MYRAAHFRKGSPCPPTLTLTLPSELGAPTATPCAAAACAQLCKPPPPAPDARETQTQVMPSALSGLWDVLIFADERGWPVSSVNSQYLKGKTCHPASPRPTTCLSPRGRAAQAWSLAPPWLVLWLSPPPSVRRSSLCWGWGRGVWGRVWCIRAHSARTCAKLISVKRQGRLTFVPPRPGWTGCPLPSWGVADKSMLCHLPSRGRDAWQKPGHSSWAGPLPDP